MGYFYLWDFCILFLLSFVVPVFANMKQMINVTANLVVTSNQLGCNNDLYDEVCHNSFYDKAGFNSCHDKVGCNSCYDKAGRIGILWILRSGVKRHTHTDPPPTHPPTQPPNRLTYPHNPPLFPPPTHKHAYTHTYNSIDTTISKFYYSSYYNSINNIMKKKQLRPQWNYNNMI